MRSLASALALAAFAGACATLVRGSRQYLSVTSQPSGAVARVGEARCETPCSLDLPRGRAATLLVEKPGFAVERVEIARHLDPLLLGNLCLPPFFILWGLVDLATGAGYELRPAFVSVALRPEAGPGGQAPSTSWLSAAE